MRIEELAPKLCLVHLERNLQNLRVREDYLAFLELFQKYAGEIKSYEPTFAIDRHDIEERRESHSRIRAKLIEIFNAFKKKLDERPDLSDINAELGEEWRALYL